MGKGFEYDDIRRAIGGERRMKKEILELLFHADDFMSGEQISDALGVSRAAV